jgi:Phage integrase, N-terminal SAM-like domain
MPDGMNQLRSERRSPLGLCPGQAKQRLYDCVLEALRSRHYSRRTEEAYLHWIRRFLAFHSGAHPRALPERDLNRFLIHLAVNEYVAGAIQNRALAAVPFLYQHVPEQPLDRIEGVVQARKPRRLPVVLNRGEVNAILTALDGFPVLTARELLGYKNVRTTMVYTQVLDRTNSRPQGPLDGLQRALTSNAGIRPTSLKQAGEHWEMPEAAVTTNGAGPGPCRRLSLRSTRTGITQVTLNRRSPAEMNTRSPLAARGFGELASRTGPEAQISILGGRLHWRMGAVFF